MKKLKAIEISSNKLPYFFYPDHPAILLYFFLLFKGWQDGQDKNSWVLQFSLLYTQIMHSSPHIALAHSYWKAHLKEGQWAVDATCGNGHDTLFLAQCILGNTSHGGVIGLDIQEKAIENTRLLLEQSLLSHQYARVHLFKQSHASFPNQVMNHSISLIVYNLGYLPKGEKQITTRTDTTLESIKEGLSLIAKGGLISITCYPGHAEGEREETALLTFAQGLSSKIYSICHHRWLNRHLSPSLIIIQKTPLCYG